MVLNKPKISILVKISIMFLLIFCVPTCLMFYLSYLSEQSLISIKDEISRTAVVADLSYLKTIDNAEKISKLQALEKLSSIGRQIEIMLKYNSAKNSLQDDFWKDLQLEKLLTAEKIGSGGYACIVDPVNDKIVVHWSFEFGDKISESLPNLNKLIHDQKYLLLLKKLKVEEENIKKGLSTIKGLINRRESKMQEFITNSIGLGLEKELWIITPIKGSKYSLAATTSLTSLAEAILKDISSSINAIKEGVKTVEKKSLTVKRVIKNNQVMIFIFAIFFTIIIYSYIRKSFIIPLKSLTLSAEAVKNGDYNIRTSLQTKDELQIFGESFNSMLDRIDNQIKTIEIK